jgi:hypothetical protein
MTKIILSNAVGKVEGGTMDIDTYLQTKNNWVEVFYHVIEVNNITPKYATKRSPKTVHFGLSSEVESGNVMNADDKSILDEIRQVS